MQTVEDKLSAVGKAIVKAGEDMQDASILVSQGSQWNKESLDVLEDYASALIRIRKEILVDLISKDN